MTSRRGLLAVGVVVAVAVSLSGLAWACTPQAKVLTVAPQAARERSAVTVRGEAVAPGGPVEIRWNAVKGPQIGSAIADPNGNFTALATVPAVPPGVYYMAVVAGDAGMARIAFEVTAPPLEDPSTATPAVSRSTGVSQRGHLMWPSSSDVATLDVPAAASDSSRGLSAGMALLAAGLVVLFSGCAVAAVRRDRRVSELTTPR